MILRGAVLSEERLSLGAQRTPVGAAAAPMPVVTASPISPSVAAAPVISAPAVAPMTLDAVKTWLAGQDAATRAELAQRLADDIETLRAAARAEGLRAGQAEGRVQAAEESRNALSALAELVAQAEIAFDDEVAEIATQCADIVCMALAKIAGPLLETRAAALGAVLEVLKRARDDRSLIIRVSPADLPALRSEETAIARACAGREFVLLADPRVDAGGCIVESALGGFDGRFDQQLRGVCETLRVAKAASAATP